MPRGDSTAAPQLPKLIFVSTTGLTTESHAARLPVVYKPLYAYFLKSPHTDKRGMERVLAHAVGQPWTEAEPPAQILPEGW